MTALQPDIRTLLLVFTLIRVAQAIALFHVWNTHRQYRPAGDWALGSFIAAFGLLLLGFRDLIPPWASVMAANFILIPGWVIFDFGIIRAAGYRVPFRLGLIISASALLLIFWNTVVDFNFINRLVIFNASVMIFDIYSAFACFRSREKNKKYTFKVIGVSLTMIIVSSVWRVASGLNLNHSTLLSPEFSQSQYFIVLIFCSIIITSMLILLTAQKLQDEINIMAQQLIRRSELERDYAQVSAMTDGLTGISNRRYFDEALNTEFHRLKRSGAPLSMIMLDIDHFKNYNDSYGHLAGDECLRLVASALKNVAGRAHDIVARYGGEEFAVILPETDRKKTGILAERLRAAVEDLAILHSGTDTAGCVTVSLGAVTVYAKDLTAPEDVVAMADKALYRAKRNGRNCVEVADNEIVKGPGGTCARNNFVQLVWYADNECGNKTIDEQHKKLFEISNELLSAFIENCPKAGCIPLLDNLLNEIVKHFIAEEEIITASGYLYAEAHKQSHADLLATAIELADKFKRDECTLVELFNFLVYGVVARHMFIEDRKFFPYVR